MTLNENGSFWGFLCFLLQTFSRYVNKLQFVQIAPDSLMTFPVQFQIWCQISARAELRHVIATKFLPPEIRHVITPLEKKSSMIITSTVQHR